ncbi:MAG: tetratricopeptide repeat protein [Terriglobales bacterium]
MNRAQTVDRQRAIAILILACLIPAWAQKAEKVPPSIDQIEVAIQRDSANPKLYVTLGLAYWDRNDYPHALEAFQRAVKVGPNSAEAHNWLGVALMGKADLPGSVAEFKKAVALDPKYSRAYTNLGSALAKSGDLDAAVDAFKKALALAPENLAAHMNLGVALREKGDAEGALVHLRRVAEADPRNADIQYELGQTLRQSGDIPGAIAAFEKALEINPEQREGYYGLGLALKQQSAAKRKPLPPPGSPADDLYKSGQDAVTRGDLKAAADQLDKALALDANDAEVHNLLGFVLGQQGDLTSALVHLERAVVLRPEWAEAHYNLGVALWYSGSKEKSISELRESVRLDPAAGPSHAFLGTALRDMGDLAGARLSLQRAIALLPPLPATYIDLGIVFLRTRDINKAMGQFEAGLNIQNPSPPEPDWDSAISALREAIAKKPDQPDAHNLLGLLLGRKGADKSEVVAEFREAVRLRPKFAQAYNNLGLVLTQTDDDEGAVAAFHEAIRIAPDYADAHANLGAALIPTDGEQAIRELEKAVALDPSSVKAQFNLATAYGASPKYGAVKEIELLRNVIAASPNFARAYLALGKALLQDGKVPEAVTELQEAARLDPQSGEAHYQLGLALSRAGRKDEAATELKRGRELTSADDRYQNVNLDISEGRAALDQGDLDQAATKFRHALKLQPDSSDAQRYLGVVLEKQGDKDAASNAYEKAVDLNPGNFAARQSLQKLLEASAAKDDPARLDQLENYIRANQFKEAEPLLADYVKEHPESSRGWYALGYSLFAQQKIGESLRALAKCLQLDVKNSEAHKILGRDLMIIGRFDAAQIEFEQGIRDDPKSAEMHYNLGKLFSMQDNWASGRKEFEEALRIDPSYVEALDALGLTQEALGDNPGAVASYEKAIALNQAHNGKFASAHVNLSAYYNRTGDHEKGLTYARQAIELDPKSDRAWFQKAKAEEGQGNLNDAADSLTQAISFNPRASSYYYVLSGVLRRLGKTKESKEALEVFTRLDKESNDLEKMRRSGANPPATLAQPGAQHE